MYAWPIRKFDKRKSFVSKTVLIPFSVISPILVDSVYFLFIRIVCLKNSVGIGNFAELPKRRGVKSIPQTQGRPTIHQTLKNTS